MPKPERGARLRVLLPVAAGHVAAVAMVAAAVPAALRLRSQLEGPVLVGVAAALLLVLALHRLAGAPRRLWGPAGQLGLALWSFFMGTAHGAGLMLVPALAPLCFTPGGAGGLMESGPLLVALAAAAIHVAAISAVTVALAAGVQRALDAIVRRLKGRLQCPLSPPA